MQLIGLILGLLGALLLTIPDEMYALYFRMTRCRAMPARQQEVKGGKGTVPDEVGL